MTARTEAKPIEEIAAEAMETVRDAAFKALHEAYGQLVNESLPFAEQDTDGNAWGQASNIVQEILAGKLDFMVAGYSGKELRAKIAEEHPHLIVNPYIKDLQEQIKDLKGQIFELCHRR